MILIFAAATAAAPSPSPAPDPCGAPQSNLLAVLDRPSIGYSPCAVKPREVLAELGYANAVGDAGRLASYPQGFLRFGAARDLELDLIGPAYGVLQNAGARNSGFFDSGFGAKYEFWHDETRALAADFLYTAPTGAAEFTVGAPVEALNVDYSMPLSGNFSVASTLGVVSGYASGRFLAAAPSVVLADQWNPRAQAFVEAFGQTRTRIQGGSLFGLDVALQYLLAPGLELDVEAGRTASDAGRAHYVGFGFGSRF